MHFCIALFYCHSDFFADFIALPSPPPTIIAASKPVCTHSNVISTIACANAAATMAITKLETAKASRCLSCAFPILLKMRKKVAPIKEVPTYPKEIRHSSTIL